MNASSVEEKLRSLTVLVVDDHIINREFLRAGLSGLVGRLDVVDSGERAIEQCRAQDYDVILMDLHMPQMDGLATALRIRDLGNRSARARMLILTADARPEERARLLTQGFDAYLNKPLSIAELKRALMRLFDPASLQPHGERDRSCGGEALIDIRRARAAVHGDTDLAMRLGLKLSRELREKLPLLDQQLLEGRTSQATALLHQWAGAAGYVGATRFSRACIALHRRLLDPASSSTGTAYTDFLRVAHATRQALSSGLANYGLRRG